VNAVEAVAEVFWLKLQDYMPGCDRETWEQLVDSMAPDLSRVMLSYGIRNLDPVQEFVRRFNLAAATAPAVDPEPPGEEWVSMGFVTEEDLPEEWISLTEEEPGE
jgi:hypothetical protein